MAEVCAEPKKNLGKTKCIKVPQLFAAMIETPNGFFITEANLATAALLKAALQTSVKAAIDGWQGARYVVRNNRIENMHVDNHGTETSLRERGIFSWEVYDNTFVYTGYYGSAAVDIRGGTGVIYNNRIVTASNFYWMVS